MFGKRMIILCFVSIPVGFVVTTYGSEDTAKRDRNEVYSEIPCLSQGGMCVRRDDCPDQARVPTKGLCPVQQRKGVECCYSIPISETRCRKRGGECMPITNRCAENLTFKRATDCAPDQKCCILV